MNLNLDLTKLDISNWKQDPDKDTNYVLNNYFDFVQDNIPILDQFLVFNDNYWGKLQDPNLTDHLRNQIVSGLMKEINKISRCYETIIEQYEIQANGISGYDKDYYFTTLNTEDLYVRYIRRNFEKEQAEELIRNIELLIKTTYNDLQNLYLYHRELANILNNMYKQDSKTKKNIDPTRIKNAEIKESEVVSVIDKEQDKEKDKRVSYRRNRSNKGKN